MADFRHGTDRLILRDWRSEDWPRFWDCTATPAVMRWLGGVPDKTEKTAARERLESYRKMFGHTFWVVERRQDGGYLSGELLGFCGLKRSNVEGERVSGMPEIGWRLREDAWRRGYAAEAATASLNLGFHRFGYAEVVALTVEGNAASRGLMTKLGMRRRTDLDYEDPRYGADLNPIIVYSIDAERWGRPKA